MSGEQRAMSQMICADVTEPAGASSGNHDQGNMNSPPGASEEISPTGKAVKKPFQKNRVAPLEVSAPPDSEPSCVPGPSCPEPEPEPEVTTKLPELPKKCMHHRLFHLIRRLRSCKLDQTPVTEVWPNVFIGNEEAARGRVKLKEMGITHILNAAAMKRNWRVLLGIPSKQDLKGTINTGPKYYKGMNITYYDVPVRNKYWFNISRYFFQSAEFIHQALSNPENKLLVHCKKGSCRSVTLFLSYLIIHQNMMVEDAIDHVMKVRRIKPNIGFLKQLLILDSHLVKQFLKAEKPPQRELGHSTDLKHGGRS